MDNEFEIIKKYFTFTGTRDDVLIAGGDDCASVSVPENKQLLITVDTLISGVHFPADTGPDHRFRRLRPAPPARPRRHQGLAPPGAGGKIAQRRG